MDELELEPALVRLIVAAPEEVRRASRRIRAKWRRATNEGVGWFLCGMISLSLAAICARIVYSTWSEYNKEVNAEIEGATSPNEPRANEDRMGVLTAFLSPINGDPKFRQTNLEESPAYKFATKLREEFRQAAALAEEGLRIFREPGRPEASAEDVTNERERRTLEHAKTAAAELLRIIQSDSLQSAWPPPPEDWQERATKAFVAAGKLSRPELKLSPLLFPDSSAAAFGPMAVHKSSPASESALVIPALRHYRFQAHDRDSLDRDSFDARKLADDLKSREVFAVHLADLFDLVVELRYRELHQAADADPELSCRIVQAYFVTPDSILWIWQPSLKPEDIPELFPPLKLWAAAHYVQKPLESGQPDYASPAYVDFARGGIVITQADAVRLSPLLDALSPSTHDSAVGQLVGVAAVDLGVPMQVFQARLIDHSRLMSIERVTFENGDERGPVVSKVERPLKTSPRPSGTVHWIALNLEDARREQFVKDAIERERSSEKLTRGVTPLTVDGKPAYLIPVERVPGKGFGALLVTFETPNLPFETRIAAALAILCGGVALCLLVQGWISSVRSSELRAKVWLMSNLQIGVIITDDRDVVREANDRAAEIFDVYMPKPGVQYASSEMPRISFLSLIEPEIVVEVSVVVPSQDGPRLQVKNYSEHITRERRSGISSSYYARMRHPRDVQRRWVRVWGTPILGRSTVAGKRRTFGIVERVEAKELCRKLDSAVDKATRLEAAKGHS